MGRQMLASPPVIPDGLHRVLVDYWRLSESNTTLPTTISAQIQLKTRRGSLVALVPAFAGRPPAVVKIHSNPLHFENEHRGLSLAASVVDDLGGVKTPAIYQIKDSEHATVSEYIQGDLFRSALRREYRTLPVLYQGAMQALGRWLSRYHRSECKKSTDNSDVDRYAGTIIGSLDKRKRWLGPSAYDSGYRLVQEIRKSLRSSSKSFVQCHGDFSLGNILIHRSSDNTRYIYVIDFAASGLGFSELDISSCRLSLSRAIGILPFSKSASHALWTAFIEGYHEEESSESSATVRDLCQLYVLTYSLEELFNYPSLGPSEKLRKLILFLQTLHRLRSWLNVRAKLGQS
jgi:tRNA A-37 threonylcarbamoyl transferase component Bud32